MDDRLLGIFKGELETQCEFVLRGQQQIEAATQQREAMGIWFGIQSILISASNASKLLWGSGKTDAQIKARQRLRDDVEVEDSSPLNDRTVRNSFEHFDERIDAWAQETGADVFLGRNIGLPLAIAVNGQPQSDNHFGHLDLSTGVVTFLNRSTELGPIVAEAKKILDILQRRRRGPKTSIA